MDRGWYIIVGCGTVCAGPFFSEMEAEKCLTEILQDNRDWGPEAYDIVYEKGLTNPA